MTELLTNLLAWIEAHPNGALWLLFGVTLFDSLLIVGAVVPAALPLFAIGTLVTLGALDLGETLLIATAGALLGDLISFALGARYGERLYELGFFRKHPELLERSRRFFDRYGPMSILMARFLGPLRAVTPALAAASGMRVWWFLLADVPAAALWSAAFIVPGMAFGASLGLAAEVAGRLAALLVLLLGGVALLVWLSGLLSRAAGRHGASWLDGLLAWSRRHRRLGRFGAALIDEDLPETPALAVLAIGLVLIAGIGLWLVAGAGLRQYPLVTDASLMQWLQDLHTPWGAALAHHLLQLGSIAVYGPLAAITLLGLLLNRKHRAAAHWIAAGAFGGVIAVGLYAVPLLPPPARGLAFELMPRSQARDLVLATVTYGFLPMLLGVAWRPWQRRLLASLSAAILGLILFAQLYLCVQWPSVTTLLMLVGLAWSALLGLGYRRHRPNRIAARRLVPLLLLCFTIALGWRWARLEPLPDLPPPPARILDATDWRAEALPVLPTQRRDVTGRLRQPLRLQWAGTRATIDAELRAVGWQTPAQLDLPHSLHWLADGLPISELPVLPRVHAGRHPSLSLRYPVDARRQYLLRLWPSGYRLDDGRPLWVGSITLQEVREVYGWLHYPIAVDLDPPLADLPAPLPGQPQHIGRRWLLSS